MKRLKKLDDGTLSIEYLTAVQPILYGMHQYEVGDELPQTELTETWVRSGAAAWMEKSSETTPKAYLVTAQPGRSGISSSGNPEDLVGRITPNPLRERDPVKRRRRRR